MTLTELKLELNAVNEELSEGEFSVKKIQQEIDSVKKSILKDYNESFSYHQKEIVKLERELSTTTDEDFRRVKMMFLNEHKGEQVNAKNLAETGQRAQLVLKWQGVLDADTKTRDELRSRREALIKQIKTLSPTEVIPETKRFNPDDHFQVEKKHPKGAYIGTIIIWVIILFIVLKACHVV